MADAKKNKLDYFNSRDQAHPLNTFYEGEENFDGILTENRKITDIFFLIVFIILNAGLIYYSQKGKFLYNFNSNYINMKVISESDLKRLNNGVDFRTDFCGQKQLFNQTYLYFYDPEAVGTVGICMENCPPLDSVDVCFYSETNNQSLEDYCYKTYHTSTVGYYCMPLELNSVKRKIIESETKSTINSMKMIAADIWRLRDLICISYGIMLFMGLTFTFSFLIKKIKIILFFMVLYFCFGFGMIAWMIAVTQIDEDRLVKKYCPQSSSAGGCEEEELFFLLVLRFIMVGVIFLLALALFAYWKRFSKIAKFIAFFNEFIQMFSLFAYLIFHFLLEIAFVLYGLFIFVSAMSSGLVQTIDAPKAFPNPQIRKIVVDDLNIYGLIFAGFMFYWWIMAFSNFEKFVISGAISTHYFSKAKQILNKPVFRGMKSAFLHNFGSILYCSIILSVVWPMRALCFRIKEIFVKSVDKTTKSFKFCLAFWTPCILFHETQLKFFRSRNLIHVVIFGDAFYRGGQRLFYLRLRSLSRINAFKDNVGFMTFIGNIFIASSGSFFVFAYLYFSTQTFLEENISEVEYIFAVPFIVFFTGLCLSNTFGNLYDLLTETILICFVADEEMFTGRHRFAEENMRKFMDLFGQESDDVRNIATTKVNPFQQDNNKENELIKYEPVPFKKAQKEILEEENFKVEDDEKNPKFEQIYDPFNNKIKLNAELVSNKTKEDEEMERSIKSNKSFNSKKSDEKLSRPESPITYKPLSQSRLPTPKTQQDLNNSKMNIIPNGNSMVMSGGAPFFSPTKNQSNFSKTNLVASKNELKIEDFSRPGSSNEDGLRPNSSNKNNGVNPPTNKSFVDIKKLEIEDLENNNENEEIEFKTPNEKMMNISNENEKKLEDLSFKNDEKNNKFFNMNMNSQFNVDKNRMKNSNFFSKSVQDKDNQYLF